jgi:hypothetical protein
MRRDEDVANKRGRQLLPHESEIMQVFGALVLADRFTPQAKVGVPGCVPGCVRTRRHWCCHNSDCV